ncbi:hypothetical protein PybrP1_001067 [[Pythium] brassicae (nom. inval.)]|nr:hypothetical protein PybrP1_001067 [[Pythium] brassicae (nom. inval.)]
MRPTTAQPSGSSSSGSGDSGSGSTSTNVSSETIAFLSPPTPTPTKVFYSREDKCTWDQSQVLCGQPRSCYDCLNVPVGAECTITAAGYCASISKYNYTLDYRRNASAGALNYFPSTNATYCEVSDATCSRCRNTVFKESTDGITNPSQFCVGDGGCVCVGFCESTVWKALTVDMTCVRPAGSTPIPTIGGGRVALTGPLRTLAIILVFFITVPVVVIVGASMRARYLFQRARMRAREARLAARAPPLALTGWKALREELIENEHETFEAQELVVTAPTVVTGTLQPLSHSAPLAADPPPIPEHEPSSDERASVEESPHRRVSSADA